LGHVRAARRYRARSVRTTVRGRRPKPIALAYWAYRLCRSTQDGLVRATCYLPGQSSIPGGCSPGPFQHVGVGPAALPPAGVPVVAVMPGLSCDEPWLEAVLAGSTPPAPATTGAAGAAGVVVSWVGGWVEPVSPDDPMAGLVASATPPTTDVAMIAIPRTMPTFGTIPVTDTGTLLLPSGRDTYGGTTGQRHDTRTAYVGDVPEEASLVSNRTDAHSCPNNGSQWGAKEQLKTAVLPDNAARPGRHGVTRRGHPCLVPTPATSLTSSADRSRPARCGRPPPADGLVVVRSPHLEAMGQFRGVGVDELYAALPCWRRERPRRVVAEW
jgi:hypothetical protein